MNRKILLWKRFSDFCFMLGLIFAGGLFSGQVAAQEPANNLFQQTENVKSLPEKVDTDIVLRQRMVDIRYTALSSGNRPSKLVRLNLFEDINLNAVLDRIDRHGPAGNSEAGFTWIGRIEGVDDSIVTFYVAGKKLSGSVEMSDVSYQIRNLDSGEHVVREIEPSLSNELISDQLPGFQADTPEQAFQTSDSQLERTVFDLVNQERAIRRLRPLKWDDRLADAARQHSLDMANNRFFGHTGSGGTSGGDRIVDDGYSWNTWGENIAAWSASETPQAVINRWMNSPGHRANILKADFCDLGVGHLGDAKASGAVWDTYWTQNFAREQGVNQCQADGPDNPPSPPDNPDDTPDDPDNTPDDNPATIDTGFYYRFSNDFLGQGRALDTYSNRGNQPFMAQTGNFSGQYWKLTPLPNGYYRLTNLFLGDGRALDTYSNGRNRPFMARTSDVSGQYWKLTSLGNGNFRLTNLFLGEGRSLNTHSDGNNEPFMGPTGKFTGQVWKLIKLQKIGN